MQEIELIGVINEVWIRAHESTVLDRDALDEVNWILHGTLDYLTRGQAYQYAVFDDPGLQLKRDFQNSSDHPENACGITSTSPPYSPETPVGLESEYYSYLNASEIPTGGVANAPVSLQPGDLSPLTLTPEDLDDAPENTQHSDIQIEQNETQTLVYRGSPTLTPEPEESEPYEHKNEVASLSQECEGYLLTPPPEDVLPASSSFEVPDSPNSQVAGEVLRIANHINRRNARRGLPETIAQKNAPHNAGCKKRRNTRRRKARRALEKESYQHLKNMYSNH